MKDNSAAVLAFSNLRIKMIKDNIFAVLAFPYQDNRAKPYKDRHRKVVY